MENINCTWEELKEHIEQLRIAFRVSRSPLLFRGQADSDWKLETTLERHGKKHMRLVDFYQLITKIGPSIGAFTLEGVPEFEEELLIQFRDRNAVFSPDRFPSIALCQYMVYLRHHGFPSPLLDWSRSLYVAAFFAFNSVNDSERPDDPPTRSIFAYVEMPGNGKGSSVGEPAIRVLKSYVKAHQRHFRQQSAYTICESFNDNWVFDSHQYVFEHSRPNQDFLYKFNLPSTERVNILRSLDDHNLNAFSLFNSEEALLATLWLREQVLEGPHK